MRRLFTALLAALALVSLSPAAASPRDAAEIQMARFQLETGDGHSVRVEGFDHRVKLVVTRLVVKRELSGATISWLSEATYRARGTASRRGLRARFGHFGLVAVDFKPLEKATQMWPPEDCSGYRGTGREGVFTGKIRFRGESGYVELDARRAPGRVAASTRWNCKPRPPVDGWGRASECTEDGRPADCALLFAAAPERREFFALGFAEAPELPIFGAAMKERHGSVRVDRHLVVGDRQAHRFGWSHELGSATVEPPPPFAGIASFQRNPDGSRSWSGTLSVSFLGHEDVPLAGPRFDAHLSPRFPGD